MAPLFSKSAVVGARRRRISSERRRVVHQHRVNDAPRAPLLNKSGEEGTMKNKIAKTKNWKGGEAKRHGSATKAKGERVFYRNVAGT